MHAHSFLLPLSPTGVPGAVRRSDDDPLRCSDGAAAAGAVGDHYYYPERRERDTESERGAGEVPYMMYTMN